MTRLTREQVRSIDRRALDEYGLPGLVLMENAARAVVDVAWQMLGGRPEPVTVFCGGGNNGGDGLAVARHLHNRGCDVGIALTVDPAKYAGDAAMQWRIVRAMRLHTGAVETDSFRGVDLLVDAIFGTGLDRPPRDPFPSVAAAINRSGVPVLSVDVPSGLDCDTGKPLGPACVRATRTVTFVAEKVGFPAAAEYLGVVTVGDIGCPRELVAAVAGG